MKLLLLTKTPSLITIPNRRSAMAIQRIYRGHLGRVQYHQEKRAKLRRERIEYFNSKATAIQKVFRGYYFRKYHLDFYERKKRLQAIAEMNEKIRYQMQYNNNLQQQQQNQEGLLDNNSSNNNSIIGSQVRIIGYSLKLL